MVMMLNAATGNSKMKTIIFPGFNKMFLDMQLINSPKTGYDYSNSCIKYDKR